MKIELSEEMSTFVKQLAHTIETQNNRCTAKPIYFTVRKNVDEMLPYECTDDKRYYDNGAVETYTEEELREKCEENGDDFDEYVDKNCTSYSVRDGEEYEGFFLTEAGCKKHIELNGHNIKCNKKGLDTYVMHLFRNPEMEQVINLIMEIGKQLNGGEGPL